MAQTNYSFAGIPPFPLMVKELLLILVNSEIVHRLQ